MPTNPNKGHTGPLLSRRNLPLFIWTVLVTALQHKAMKLANRVGYPTDGVEL